jgi:toxin ParE1/3/4
LLTIHPSAFEEIKATIKFYNSKVEGLGGLFLDEVERGIDLIKYSPKTWSKHNKHCHRFLLSKFPFSVIYRLKDQNIETLAVMHNHRKPNYWKKRIN